MPVFATVFEILSLKARKSLNFSDRPLFEAPVRASAWHQLYLPLLPFTHARSECINADSLRLQLLTARKKELAGHSRQFTPGGLPENCETHCVSGNRTHDLPIVSPTRYQLCHQLGAYGTPILGGTGGRRGSAMAPLERAMVVSYRLSIVTTALSVTIPPQFAIECLRRSNQDGWVTLGPNLGVFPLEQTRHVGVVKERTSQAN